jgi:hypothetical protein
MSLGPELLTNGDFATGDFTGWDENTVPGTSIVANACKFDNNDGTVFLGQDFSGEVGKNYSISYDVTLNPGAEVAIGEFVLSSGSIFGSGDIPVSVGSHTLIREAVNASPTHDLRFVLVNTEPTDTITIDNVSVKEVLAGGGLRSRYSGGSARSRYSGGGR